MAKAVKLVIKNESGYLSTLRAVKEKMIITANSVSYEMMPKYPFVKDLNHKWSYTIDSEVFLKYFDKLIRVVDDIVENSEPDEFIDCGYLGLEIFYEDETSAKYEDYLPINSFPELVNYLKYLVPTFEDLPPFVTY